jgi:hypothetical protein
VPVTVLGLTLEPARATIAHRATVPLRLTHVGPASAYGSLAWTSSAPAVATVDAEGVVRGVGPGVARVAAVASADPRLRAEAEVTVACTADFRYGLIVQPRDSLTGGALTAPATVVVRGGGFADSVLTLGPGEGWSTAGERPGTYRVVVRAPGYAEWARDGVVVGHDGCHVIPVTLVARLQRR